MNDDAFLAAFEAQRIPLHQWHHREHVRLAYLYLQRMPFEQAEARVRAGLKAYIAAHNVPDHQTSGFHATLTVAWLRLVAVVLAEYGPATDSEAFCEEHPELLEKKALRLFYSRDRISSPQAKATFVEPDLAPLPVARSRPAVPDAQ